MLHNLLHLLLSLCHRLMLCLCHVTSYYICCTVSFFIRRAFIIALYFVQTFLPHSPSVGAPARRHSSSSLVAEPSRSCSCLLSLSVISHSAFSLLSQRRLEDLNVCLFLFANACYSVKVMFGPDISVLDAKNNFHQNQNFWYCALLSEGIWLSLQSFCFPRNWYKPKWRHQNLSYFSLSTKLEVKYFCLLCCNRNKRKWKQRDK